VLIAIPVWKIKTIGALLGVIMIVYAVLVHKRLSRLTESQKAGFTEK